MKIQIPEKVQILDGSALKMIAVVTMLIDHTAAAVLWNVYIHPHIPIRHGSALYTLYLIYRVMRSVGRCAFPIFCFMLVEGFRYTHSRKNYALRMLVFALVSEVPFDLGLYGTPFYPGHQNVIFTLLLGLLMMTTWEEIGKRVKRVSLRTVLQFSSALGWGLLAYLFKTDYDYKGIALILVFYLFRYTREIQITAGALVMFWEWPAVLSSFVLLTFYSGKRGKGRKYFFYWFYPVHLFLLFLLAFCLRRLPA